MIMNNDNEKLKNYHEMEKEEIYEKLKRKII